MRVQPYDRVLLRAAAAFYLPLPVTITNAIPTPSVVVTNTAAPQRQAGVSGVVCVRGACMRRRLLRYCARVLQYWFAAFYLVFALYVRAARALDARGRGDTRLNLRHHRSPSCRYYADVPLQRFRLSYSLPPAVDVGSLFAVIIPAPFPYCCCRLIYNVPLCCQRLLFHTVTLCWLVLLVRCGWT